MKNEFDKKNFEKYINQHCLYKTYDWDNWTSIYIYDIKDGIIKYKDNNGNVVYSDVSKFENLYFRINPCPPVLEEKENKFC